MDIWEMKVFIQIYILTLCSSSTFVKLCSHNINNNKTQPATYTNHS